MGLSCLSGAVVRVGTGGSLIAGVSSRVGRLAAVIGVLRRVGYAWVIAGVVGALGVSSASALRWSAPQLLGPRSTAVHKLVAVSCPSASLCVAIDAAGEVVTSTEPTAHGTHWRVSTPLPGLPVGPDPNGLNAISCPSTTLCVAVGGAHVAVSTDPAGGASAWQVEEVGGEAAFQDGGSLDSVSCPSITLCVAGDRDGNVVTSTTPAAAVPGWTVTNIEQVGYGETLEVSCADPSHCVAVDGEGLVLSSTNPTGGSSAWSTVNLGYPLYGISCPSASLCVAVGSASETYVQPVIATTSNPAAGAAAWSRVRLPSNVDPGNISCASASLCVAEDYDDGYLLASSSPTGAASTWTRTRVPAAGSNGIYDGDVSCGSSSSCVSIVNGDAYGSTNPGAENSWALATVDSYTVASPLIDLSCATGPLCVAIDQAGDVLTSTNPRIGAGTWRRSRVDRKLTAISCPSRTLCVAVDARGDVLTSTRPTAGARSWRSARVDPGPGLSAISCPSTSFCIAGDYAGDLLTSTNPTGGRRAWRRVQLPSNGDSPGILSGFACPSRSLCVGVDQSTGEGFIDDVFTSTRPAGGSNGWHLTTEFNDNSFDGVACPSRSLCVAVTDGGEVITASDPTRASSWVATVVNSNVSLNAIACPSSSLCLTGDNLGSVETSRDPAGGVADWPAQSVDPGDSINALACVSTRLCLVGTADGKLSVGTS